MCANYLKAEVENLLSLPSDSQEIEKLVSEINDERDRKLLLMSSYMIVCLSCDSLKDSPKKEEFRAYSQLKDWLQLPPDIVQKIEQDADRELKSDKFKIDDGQDIEGAPSGWIHELRKVFLEKVAGIIAGAFLAPLFLLIPGTSPPPPPPPSRLFSRSYSL
jgi:hypothetical protein